MARNSKKKKLENTPEKRKSLGITYKRTSFSSILRQETSLVFLERFVEKISNMLIKAYEEREAKRIITFLKKSKIVIVNPETFLFKYTSLGDTSINIYNNAQDPDEFFFEAFSILKKRAEDGETDIVLREFFLVLIDLFSRKNNIPHDNLLFYIKYLVLSMSNITHPTPFTMQIMHPLLIKEIQNYIGLDLKNYSNLYSFLFAHLKDLLHKNVLVKKDAYFPKVEILFPVNVDVRINQIYYLSSVFKMTPESMKQKVNKIQDLSKITPEFEVLLEELINKSENKTINKETIFLELKRLEKTKPLKTYPLAKEMYKNISVFKMYRDIFRDQKFKKVYVYSGNYQDTFRPYISNIIIDCKNETKEHLEEYIDAAKNLSLVRENRGGGLMSTNTQIIKTHKITFLNADFKKEFLDFIETKINQVRSLTNADFIYEIRFNPDKARNYFKDLEASHIRVISDIHADYNRDKNYIFNFGDDYVINCGDTAGDAISARDWIRFNTRKGIVIAGNHLGYSPSHPELNTDIKQNEKMYGHPTHVKNTKSEQLYEASVTLTGEYSPRIMSNSEEDYAGMKILGSTLYTDFALYGEEHIEESMAYAQKYMNDFKLITVAGHREYKRNRDGSWDRNMRSRSKSQIRLFTPQDHAYFFKFSLAFLKEKVTEYKNKPIVIVTHHAPTPYAISPQYSGSMLNPAFASNLNQFIIENPNIRLWCFGHVHSSFDFILGETRMVCEPFGYGNENNQELKLPFDYGKRIAIADIKSKKSWREILKKEIETGEIKCYDK